MAEARSGSIEGDVSPGIESVGIEVSRVVVVEVTTVVVGGKSPPPVVVVVLVLPDVSHAVAMRTTTRATTNRRRRRRFREVFGIPGRITLHPRNDCSSHLAKRFRRMAR